MSGERYIGSWANSKKHGSGRYYFENGDFYDGEFFKDLAKGVGVYYHANGNIYKVSRSSITCHDAYLRGQMWRFMFASDADRDNGTTIGAMDVEHMSSRTVCVYVFGDDSCMDVWMCGCVDAMLPVFRCI
jgi:hypothetical protein